jgi:hypothetical protein
MRTEQLKLALGVVAVVALGYPLFAASTSPSNRTLQYRGRLDRNGAPLNEGVDVRVGLFTSPGDSTACLANAFDSSCGVWREEHTNVNVMTGMFDLTLGSVSTLSDAAMANNALYVGMAVRPTGNGNTFAALLGLQKLNAVAFAMANVPQTDFRTEGLTVTGAVTGKDGTNSLRMDSAAGGAVYLGQANATAVHVGSNGMAAGGVVMTRQGAITGASLAVTGNISTTSAQASSTLTPVRLEMHSSSKAITLASDASTLTVTDGTTQSTLTNDTLTTGNVLGRINGVNLRVKTTNLSGLPCSLFCMGASEGFSGACLGSRTVAGAYVDCGGASIATQLICLCATY